MLISSYNPFLGLHGNVCMHKKDCTYNQQAIKLTYKTLLENKSEQICFSWCGNGEFHFSKWMALFFALLDMRDEKENIRL